MDYLDLNESTDADPQAVIGATLCMMSCTMQSGCAIYLPRIARNLAWLSKRTSLDPYFRRLCDRLSDHWEQASQQLPPHETPPAQFATRCIEDRDSTFTIHYSPYTPRP